MEHSPAKYGAQPDARRTVIVSNRLPVAVQWGGDGLRFTPSIGGLATGLQSVHSAGDNLWIGWCGIPTEELSESERETIDRKLKADFKCVPVFLTRGQIELFYNCFSNKTTWPLFHYFPTVAEYSNEYWEGYREVNGVFLEALLVHVGVEDVIWVQDYHLMLLPQLIREQLPEAKIGFFLHIPFPSYEIFRLLPWRKDLLQGMLGADLVGFHTYDYVRHFLSSVRRLLFLGVANGDVSVDSRQVKADAFPMGIDFHRYAGSADNREVREAMNRLRPKVGGSRLILSVDRLDYTKGILQRLHAYGEFLARYPQWREQVTLILIAAPSRTQVSTYRDLELEIDKLVSRINGLHGIVGWTPIQYFFRRFDFVELTALYHLADILLVTPLRDGMNLVAKEYMAARPDGVAIISETTGAAREFYEGLIVNPNSTQDTAEAVQQALLMPRRERERRAQAIRSRLQRYNVARWAGDNLEGLRRVCETRGRLWAKRMTPSVRDRMTESFRLAHKHLFVLNYNGTLVPFGEDPAPDPEIRELLARLAADHTCDLVITSSSDRDLLQSWFGELAVRLIAERGAWVRERGGEWRLSIANLSTDWKDAIRPALEFHVDRTPGLSIAERQHVIFLNYRRCVPELAKVRLEELRETLQEMDEHLSVRMHDDTGIAEIQQTVVSKGMALWHWLSTTDYDFLLCAGNDSSDEEVFAVMPPQTYSIKVGYGRTAGRWVVESPEQLRALLTVLTGSRAGVGV